MEVDKHKVWLIIGISIAVIAIAFFMLYPSFKEGVAGKAIIQEEIWKTPKLHHSYFVDGVLKSEHSSIFHEDNKYYLLTFSPDDSAKEISEIVIKECVLKEDTVQLCTDGIDNDCDCWDDWSKTDQGGSESIGNPSGDGFHCFYNHEIENSDEGNDLIYGDDFVDFNDPDCQGFFEDSTPPVDASPGSGRTRNVPP